MPFLKFVSILYVKSIYGGTSRNQNSAVDIATGYRLENQAVPVFVHRNLNSHRHAGQEQVTTQTITHIQECEMENNYKNKRGTALSLQE